MHSFLVRLRALALVECMLCSAVAVGLWLLRVKLSGTLQLGLLPYNLCLAWIPWFLSALMTLAPPRMPWQALLPAWLVFLPNAPYLLTDFVHLRARPGVPLWLDILVFFSFALSGCLLGFHSVRHVEQRVAERLGRRVAGALALCSLMLCGVGIYLGRFPRLNTWDLWARPLSVLDVVLASVVRRDAAAFSVLLGALLVTAYACVRAPWLTPAAPAPGSGLPPQRRRSPRLPSPRSPRRAARCPYAA